MDAVRRWSPKFVFPISPHSKYILNRKPVCIGLHLAQMELRIATAAFFRTYPNAKVSSLDGFGDNDMEQVIYFLMYPRGKRCLIEAS
jgi:hypothetical protein